MGSESGEGLRQIVQRKELERQTGSGIFCWGIGNALGDSVRLLSSFENSPQVLFSPMASKAKAEDAAPAGVLLWTSYLDQHGNILPLPAHVLVTSRANAGGANKSRHYALFCYSDASLELADNGTVFVGSLRNLATGNALGASQVSAVVKRQEGCEVGRAYPVAFRALLAAPHYAQLANPVLLQPADIDLINEASSGSSMDWKRAVARLR